jgi:hypothetical protein
VIGQKFLRAALVVGALIASPFALAQQIGVSPIVVAVAQITGLGTNVATWLATPSSANLIAALTDETGTGAAVFANTPTLVTPVLGAATATSINFGGTSLANYVEGTWTPTLVSTGGGAPAYTLQVGSYERIGRQVTTRFTLSLSGAGTLAAGTLTVGGLPITATATANDNGACVISTWSSFTLDPNYTNIGGIVAPSATAIGLVENSSVAVSTSFNLQFGNITTASAFVIRGVCNYHA